MERIKELINDQLISSASSIGATNVYCAVSKRYSFVPTITGNSPQVFWTMK